MEPVTHGITLDGVARFVDIATDALSVGARGDRRPQRLSGARRRHRHQHVPHRLRRPRRAARGSRGRPRPRARGRDGAAGPRRADGRPRQLGGDPQPDAARLRRPPRRRGTGGPAGADHRRGAWRRPPTPATPPSARPVEGTILTVARAASDAALATAEEPGARARDVFTAAAAAARVALATHPRAARRCSRRRASSTPAVAASPWSSTRSRPPRRGVGPMPYAAPIGTHAIPVDHCRAASDDLTEDGPAYEVMYLLDTSAATEEAERRRRAPRDASGAGRQPRRGGRRRAVERPRARRRRGRRHRGRASPPGARTGSGSPTSPSRSPTPGSGPPTATAAGSSPWRPAPGSPSCSSRPAPWWCPAGPGQRPSTGQLLEAITACGAARGRRAAQRRRHRARRRDRRPHRRGRARHRPSR